MCAVDVRMGRGWGTPRVQDGNDLRQKMWQKRATLMTDGAVDPQ